MDKKIFQKIADIVGQKNCSNTLEDLHCYSYDSSSRRHLPEAVALPGSTGEVSAIMELADRYAIAVTPRGAGSGTTGGALPVRGGIVVSTARMNRIISIDSANMMAIVEPGVITGEFQRALKKYNLMYPPDPASLKFCTIGGNVAECAGGPSAVKYGVTRDHILGLEVVLADGRILHTGTRTEKGVVGYDLTRLFTGSEGTLGIITKCITRLQNLPEHKETFLITSSSLRSCTETVSRILGCAISPCTLEYMDQTSIRIVSKMLPAAVCEDIRAMLIVEIDGKREQVLDQCERLKTLIADEPHCLLRHAATETEIEEIWKARRLISPACFQISRSKTSEDVVVPRSAIPELVSFCEKTARRLDLTILTFGHAGDGNIHVNIMSADSGQDAATVLQAKTAIFEKVLSMDGTISGEHGVGITKSEFLHMELDQVSIEVMMGIKHLLDPRNIMNPGKIFHSA